MIPPDCGLDQAEPDLVYGFCSCIHNSFYFTDVSSRNRSISLLEIRMCRRARDGYRRRLEISLRTVFSEKTKTWAPSAALNVSRMTCRRVSASLSRRAPPRKPSTSVGESPMRKGGGEDVGDVFIVVVVARRKNCQVLGGRGHPGNALFPMTSSVAEPDRGCGQYARWDDSVAAKAATA